MDLGWAVKELEEFIELSSPVNASGGGLITPSSRPRSSRMQVLEQWVVAQRIIDQIFPTWISECQEDSFFEFGKKRDAAIHARQLLLRSAEMEKNLGPAGPSLSSESLHPWIWQPAKLLWTGGHYREAVQAAATKLEAEARNKLGRPDLDGRELLREAFSSNEQSGRARFQVPEYLTDKSKKSFLEGLRGLSEACFAFARNLTTHELNALDENEALEHLSMLSLLARQVEKLRVIS